MNEVNLLRPRPPLTSSPSIAITDPRLNQGNSCHALPGSIPLFSLSLSGFHARDCAVVALIECNSVGYSADELRKRLPPLHLASCFREQRT